MFNIPYDGVATADQVEDSAELVQFYVGGQAGVTPNNTQRLFDMFTDASSGW